MSKVLVNESSLTGIANAIRGKNGETTTYKPSEMAAAITAISGGGSGPEIPESAFVISGNCSHRFTNDGWNWFIEQYGDKITTQNITNTEYMFFNSSNLISIPFEINCSSGKDTIAQYMFNNCYNLRNIPKINNLRLTNISYLFNSCYRLRNIPDDFINNWDWSYIDNQASAYSGAQNGIFFGCYSLRSIPMDLISHGNPNVYYGYSYFTNGFCNCYVIDELVNLPIPYTATWTSNAFFNTFNKCYRLKNITFAMQEDGTPYVMNWKSQTIDLYDYLGYAQNKYFLDYNSGITADKEVTDATTYQALKNDADWFTTNVAYSRYNHDSAVATINSLPDTSAYLASAGGTNTIKFKGAAGASTDGGAINTLTEEEIAVATAKGWTISLT